VLRIDRVSKSFSGLIALRDVTVTAAAGCVTGIIGPNGSGKTTLLNVASGVLPVDAGTVWLDDRKVDLRRPDLAARQGIGRTFQIPRVVRRMTVLQNVLVGPRNQPGESLRRVFLPNRRAHEAEQRIQARAWSVLDLLDLTHQANEWAATLSGGQLKLLSLGIALMNDPRVLLLDEPAAGVNPKLIERLLEVLGRLRNEGRVIVIIEHNMEVIQSISDRVVVMSAGEVIFEGAPSEVERDQRVVQVFLGVEPART
jgi:ABC-type branched-subunit amino acid transport system ATPase component